MWHEKQVGFHQKYPTIVKKTITKKQIRYISHFFFRPHGAAGKKIFKALTFREIEYLEYMRKKNIILYQEVLEQIKENILGSNAPNLEDGFPLSDRHPLYPSLPLKEAHS